MNVGVFLCLEPYTSLENNLRLAHEYGFNYADITDTQACNIGHVPGRTIALGACPSGPLP